MHREAAKDVAALRPSPFHAPVLKSDLGKFFHVKEFRAAKMVISLFDSSIDAADVDLRCNDGTFWTRAIKVNPAAELCEFPMGSAKELVHTEADRRAGRIEFVDLVR
jgi:hypothetical protein